MKEVFDRLRSLTAKWRELSKERAYPYGKLMRPFAQDAYQLAADALDVEIAQLEEHNMKNQDSRVGVQSQVPAVGSTAKIATGDVPTK